MWMQRRQSVTGAIWCFQDAASAMERHISDPTETSIILAAHKNGMPKADLLERYPRLAELPFDSDRKLMSTVNKIQGKNIVIVKGAFDMMETRCTAGDLNTAREVVERMSREALRVLAIAYKEIDEVPQNPTSEELENGLTLMGLVGMIDPPRPEAKAAVESDIMDRRPKPKNESIFANGYGIQIILQGIMFAALTLIAFWIGENEMGSLAD